jgi:2-iminobutanoate/2-iminopropanoate deaminase
VYIDYNKGMIETVYPQNWQDTRGIYSPAKKIDLGDCYLIFVSGQQARYTNEKHEVTSGIEQQTNEVFEQLNDILKAAGASMDDVVKAQIFLTDIADFKVVSAIRDKWFAKSKPVSTLLAVNGFTRQGAKIEIEVAALLKK